MICHHFPYFPLLLMSETDTPTFETLACALLFPPHGEWYKPAFDTRSCPNAEKCTPAFFDSFAYRIPMVSAGGKPCAQPCGYLVHRELAACRFEAHNSPRQTERPEFLFCEDQGRSANATILVTFLAITPDEYLALSFFHLSPVLSPHQRAPLTHRFS